jgi:mRNA interferase RelE/StbE
MYNITITKKANKALTSLQSRYRERIAETIQRLGYNPDDATLDIKPLTNHDTAGFRLRVGDYRVLFNRDDEIRVIAIERIAHRQEVY